MATTTPKEVTEEVARIAWELLDERYGNTLPLDRIAVIPKIDRYGDEYLAIYIVYEGRPEMLDTKWALRFPVLMGPELRQLGVDTFPSTSYVPSDEWGEMGLDPAMPVNKRNEMGLKPPPPPANATIAHVRDLEVYRKRHHDHGDAEFLLAPVSESVVRVTHRDQAGYFGIAREWEDSAKPYTSTSREDDVRDDGIGGAAVGYHTPGEALESLCEEMLTDQRDEDARQARAEKWPGPATSVLRDFLEAMLSGPARPRESQS